MKIHNIFYCHFTRDLLLCSAQTPKKFCLFADNHYPISAASTVGMVVLYRSNITPMQWIFIAFHSPGEMLILHSSLFNLWARVTDWVDSISSSFYISPFSFLVHFCETFYLPTCTNVMSINSRKYLLPASFLTLEHVLYLEKQNENKLCQSISLSKLIKMHSALFCEDRFAFYTQKKQCMQSYAHISLKAPNTNQNMQNH